MSAATTYTISPKEAYAELMVCASKGLTPLLTSSPGIGKSSIVQQLAKDYSLELIDLRLSQCTPEDLNGFPMRQGDKASFTPFDIFPLKGEPLPEGKQGWVLFLDELTSAAKSVQAAAYKLILDRMVGSYHLHDNLVIIAAGNKTTDKAVVHQQSTALQSRLIHYELDVSASDFIEHAYKSNFDYRIISFINYLPSRLMDFRPDHQDKTFACPRTWEFLSKLIKDEPVNESILPRIAGTIGSGVAVEFVTFVKEFDRLPKLEKIIEDSLLTPVPDEPSTRYATVSMLIESFTEDNINPLIQYIERFPIEFQILFVRGAHIRYPNMRGNNNVFDNYLLKMVKYLS